MPLWLTKEEVWQLHNLIKTYNELTEEKKRIANRHARATYILCENNHLIKLTQEKTATKTLQVPRRRKKLKDVPDRCPLCGGKIVEVIDMEPRIDVKEILDGFDRWCEKIERQAFSMIEDHPVYKEWLSKVKGLGKINSARLIYLLETQRDLSKSSKLMARTGAYFVAVCEKCRVYYARNVPPPPQKVLCPICGNEMYRTIPGKWLVYYKPLDWKPQILAKRSEVTGRYPIPYDPRMRDIIYKSVTGIYGYTWRFALPKFVKNNEEGIVPWYGVWVLYKMAVAYQRYSAEKRRRPFLSALSAGVYSCAKVLLTHLWLVAMCLKYPDNMEEWWRRRLPKSVMEQGHQGTVPFVDVPVPAMDELYSKIVPDKYKYLIEHTYSDLTKMLKYVVEQYKEKKIQKLVKGAEQERAQAQKQELERLGLEEEGEGEEAGE